MEWNIPFHFLEWNFEKKNVVFLYFFVFQWDFSKKKYKRKHFFSQKPCMGAKGGHFEEKLFCIFKIIFFNEKIKVEKKMDHHFDVEFCQESIFGTHKCNGAPQTPLWTQLLFSLNLSN